MLKITSEDELQPYIISSVAACEKAVADYKKGKLTAIKQILGAVMKSTGGRADPILAEKMIENELIK
jgi:aspartyl-tRNA(Asn)/glutamyl-tRNA(Gln) amidotransferase subunit B